MQDFLNLCGNRRVLFNNKAENEAKRSGQVQQLLSLVNMVVAQNDGKPYTNELFTEIKVNTDIRLIYLLKLGEC